VIAWGFGHVADDVLESLNKFNKMKLTGMIPGMSSEDANKSASMQSASVSTMPVEPAAVSMPAPSTADVSPPPALGNLGTPASVDSVESGPPEKKAKKSVEPAAVSMPASSTAESADVSSPPGQGTPAPVVSDSVATKPVEPPAVSMPAPSTDDVSFPKTKPSSAAVEADALSPPPIAYIASIDDIQESVLTAGSGKAPEIKDDDSKSGFHAQLASSVPLRPQAAFCKMWQSKSTLGNPSAAKEEADKVLPLCPDFPTSGRG
jgi:hypothetical protein